MKVKITKEVEVTNENLVDILANVLFNNDLGLKYDIEKYDKYEKILNEETKEVVCYEDVLVKMLECNEVLKFNIYNNGEKELNYDNFIEGIKKELHNNIEIDDWDFCNCYRALQYALYEDIIYD